MFTISVLCSRDETLVAALRARQMRVSSVDLDRLHVAHPPGSKGPSAFVVDIRELRRLPKEIAQVRRQFPASGLVIVARTIDAGDLLEAMRMGVNEWVAEPLNLDELIAAIQRVARPAAQTQNGLVLAVVGAKGGVGATTVAVNLATSLQHAAKQPTLLIDLHMAHGDAAVFLGAEPRFSVLDALENLQRMDETYLKSLVTPTKAGIDLLGSSSSVATNPFDATRVRGLIEFAATAYRYVVLDCPRTDATMLEALDSASQVVVLANQELTSIRSASRIMAHLRQRCGTDRVKLAMSRMDPNADIAQSDIERVLGGPVKYVFPNDYRASSTAITRGEPLILQNHSRLASSLEEVAHDLGGLPRKSKDGSKAGLFGRLSARR